MAQKERGEKMGRKTTQARHDAAVLPRIRALEAADLSLREVADQLQADGFPFPRRGARWSHVAVMRILERADKTPSQAAATTLNVTGPVHVTGQVTIITDAPVNIKTADAPALTFSSKDSTILLPGPDTLSLLSRATGRGMVYELALPLAGTLVFPDPLFLRRRV